MKVLITGAAGFIGYHLAKALLKRGETVVGIDNINAYYDVNLKYARLAECGIEQDCILEDKVIQSQTLPSYYFQKSDITNLSVLKNLFETYKFDTVLNMAAQPGVRYSLENPHAYIQSNIVGFVNILECCRHNKVKHLVYASSSSVYGMNAKIPFNEHDRVDYPVSLYAATKKSNELLAYTYSHLYQLPTTGLRFFTVYGPWGRPDMAPMLFADAIYSGDQIKVFNHGELERDFTYIDDIISGVLNAKDCIPGVGNQDPYYNIFNIGNSKPVKLMDFIQAMERAIGIPAKLDMYPMQPGDVKSTWADIQELKDKTGYEPKVLLEDGIASFIDWYLSTKHN